MPHWLRLESGKRAFKTYLTDIKQTVFLLRVGEKRTILDKTYFETVSSLVGGVGVGGEERRRESCIIMILQLGAQLLDI